MNNKLLIGLMVVLGVLGGMVGAVLVKGQVTGGDFAGGITPSQLFTPNTTANSLTPVLLNLYVNGGLSAGGTGLQNQMAAFVSTTSTIPTSVTLGPFGSTTSSATSSFSLNGGIANLQTGDPCSGSANTSTIFVDGCQVTSVGTTTATGTLAYSNLLNSVVTVSTTFIMRIGITHLPY